MTMHQLYTHAQRSRTSASTSAAAIQDKLAPAGKKRRNAPGKPKPKPRRAAPQQQQPHARPRVKQQPYQRQKQHQQPQQQPGGGAFSVFREWSAADVPPGLEPFVSATITAQQNQNAGAVPKGKAKRERDPLDDPPPPPRTPLAPLPLPCTGRPRSNSFYLPNHAGSSGIPPAAYRRPRALTSPTSPVFRTPATTGAALAQAEAAVLRENRCRLVAGLLLNRVRARPLCPARRLLCYAAPRPYVPSCLSSEVAPV